MMAGIFQPYTGEELKDDRDRYLSWMFAHSERGLDNVWAVIRINGHTIIGISSGDYL